MTYLIYNAIRKKLHLALVWMLVLFAAMDLSGCLLGQNRQTANAISKEELRDRLDNFAAESKVVLDAAIREIEQASDTKKTQMISVQMRVKFLQGLNAMMNQDDAVVSFINTWAFCVRLRIYLEEGEGMQLYDKNQHLIVAAARKIEAHIEDVGKLFLLNGTFETTQKSIREFAMMNPIQANYSNLILYPTDTKSEQYSTLKSIVGIPMTPFRAIEGVDRTATAVNRFTDTANHFSDVIADLPESTRWQLLMLLYELEESEMAVSLVSSTDSLSDSAAKLAAFSDRLPERLREQTSLLLEEVDRKQANLQTTLQQAEKVSATVQAALETVKDASASIDVTAKSVKDTADAWGNAAKTTADVAKDIALLIPEQKESASEPIRIQDIQQTMDKATAAATELRAATAEIKQLVSDDFVSRTTAILVWRILELVAAILAMGLIYKLIVRKIDKWANRVALEKK
jgi:hypothetical protein